MHVVAEVLSVGGLRYCTHTPPIVRKLGARVRFQMLYKKK